MRKVWIIGLLLLAIEGRTWAGTGEERRHEVDSLLDRALEGMKKKHLVHFDSIAYYSGKALQESRAIAYPHGIALAIACQAFLVNEKWNDFPRGEQLARESLAWFDQTNEKRGVTVAHYVLGFALFAQSHFDEANRHFDLAREYARKEGNKIEEIYMLQLTGEAYRESGEYEQAFNVLRQSGEMADSANLPGMARSQYLMLAGMFVSIEDYADAERYFRLGCGEQSPKYLDPWDQMVYATLMTREEKYDSALYYLNSFDTVHLPRTMLRTYLATKGEYYLFREEYATALPYILKSLAIQRRMNDNNQIMRCLQDLSRTYYGLGQDAEAFQYGREGLQLAMKTKARQNVRDGYRQLYLLYDRRGRTDSAYVYFKSYIAQKDSVLSDWTKGQFASYGYEQQIKLLNKDRELSAACLREEMLTKNLLIAGILVLLLLSGVYIWIVRLKRRNEEHRRKQAEDELEIQRLEGERSKAALQQRAKELEVQALRSQMNPHFIFNCLSSINHFVLNNETDKASEYLTRFARLIRMVLLNAGKVTITLEEELEMLRLYLNMEQLRFKEAFDYFIYFDEGIQSSMIQVPSFILQPFCENAIWHGLLHREGKGQLTLHFSSKKEQLICSIRDNGIGRRKAAEMKAAFIEKGASLGNRLSAERLALFNEDSSGASFVMEDIFNEKGEVAGTQVILTISLKHGTDESSNH